MKLLLILVLAVVAVVAIALPDPYGHHHHHNGTRSIRERFNRTSPWQRYNGTLWTRERFNGTDGAAWIPRPRIPIPVRNRTFAIPSQPIPIQSNGDNGFF
ncbi:AAEL004585-PA [Aedes aegypti]|uniref:AAEL004585-PA n=2 Tax=Aedes aegypti TaxID=7159 RepID=A0A1S4F864_AEDAE|nr:uncharacterized protein LOC5565096 [Aedes aegypti]EAT44006.1 AAEL004585-PA [Aedes aegypti]